MEKIICPICNCLAGNHYLKKNNYQLYRCDGCGTIFVHPLPSLVADIYVQDYFAGAKKGFGYVNYDQDKAVMKSIFQGYLKEISQLTGGLGSLFDIGAATGFFLHLAKADGWLVSGVEISDYAASQARLAGLAVGTGVVGDQPIAEGKTDVVTMWDVIEHVRDPLADLRLINKMLRSGGLLAINTPNSGSLFARLAGPRWHLLVPPEHLYYFTVQSLTLALEQNGFRVVRVKYPGKIFTLEYIFHTLSRWQGLLLWNKILAFLERHSKLGQVGLPINFRDNVLIYAVKISG